jgi:hypothetical protein
MSFKMYAITRNIGSQAPSSGFLNAPITGPLNSSQYPLAMTSHNAGILNGIRPTPPQFFPHQEPVNSDMNVNARRNYVYSNSVGVKEKKQEDELGKLSTPIKKIFYSSKRSYILSSHMNYIKPMDSSSRLNILKSRAVGKSSYKIGLSNDAYLSTKNYDNNYVRSCVRKSRSGGCTAPKKKGSIYNTSLHQSGINSWGSIPRQNYS